MQGVREILPDAFAAELSADGKRLNVSGERIGNFNTYAKRGLT